MVTVRTVKEFARKNENDLKRFMQFKTGICDPFLLEDAVQEFYIRLIESNALGLYDEKRGEFDTYIGNLFCWMMPLLQRRAFRHKHTTIPRKLRIKYGIDDEKANSNSKAKYDFQILSTVKRDDRLWADEEDVFEFVDKDFASLKINRAYEASLYDLEDDPLMDEYVEEFKAYIRRTESPRNAKRMLLFIEQKFAGCRGVDIAGMLGVSSAMVRNIKQDLQKKYVRWQRVAV
jgi:DNA-directed RNA polymerase specialized sigma24 family protein